LRVGRRFVQAGILTDPRDVFFLHVEEVSRALRDPPDLRRLVADRRADHERWSAVRPPKYLGKPPASDAPPNRFEPKTVEQTDDRVLQGVGACAGTARGAARIVRSPQDFGRVQPGDVLVCPSSNPSWVPLFGIIAGLVTNTGGVLSHAAVVAREFGVPAVVGTGDATQRLRDGQLLEVDGTVGEVRLL
jgi:pyruvate,water dikinase